MAEDRELGLQLQQVSFGSPIKLALLRRGIATIAFGNVTGDGERHTYDSVSGCFRLSSSAVLDDAQDLAAERDSLLPHLQVSQSPCHEGNDGTSIAQSQYRMSTSGSKRTPIFSD